MKQKKMQAILSSVLAAAMLVAACPVYAAEPADETETEQLPQIEETLSPEESETPAETDPPEERENSEESGNPAESESPEESETPDEPEESETPEDAEPSEETAIALRTDHTSYMSGYGNGKFGPNDTLSWAQVSTILYNLLEDQSMGEGAHYFPDVASGSWYYTAITTLASRGILTSDGSNFGPDETITRGDFLILVMKLVGTDPEATCDFPDVSPEDACYAAVATAVEKGWIQGLPDGTFGTNDTLTRAQAVVVLNRLLDRHMDQDILATADDLREYTDVKTTSWCYADIMEATIDHEGQVDEDEVEQWLSYTPSYLVSYYYSGSVFREKVYAGEYACQTPKTDSYGRTITRWIFPATGVMKNPSTTAIYGPTSYSAWYAPSLISDHSQYISGYTDGSFQPNGTLSRAEAVQILYNLLSDQSRGPYPAEYTDVSESAWYGEAVLTLASRGLLISGGTFRPNDAITRGEFVEMVTKMVPYQSAKLNFSDVASNNAYYSAIATAVSKGWVSGYPDGTFRPNGSLSRAEAVTVFNKILGRTGDTTTEQQMDSRYTFTDVASTSWYYQAIMEAATTHTYTWNGTAESWSTYTHNYTKSVSWESSESVVAAASITNTITSTYSGDYTHNYNWDFSEAYSEAYVNNNGYSSSTNYLIWVSRQNQKVYVFYGSKGNWDRIHTFICGTGKSGSATPTGVTKTTYKQTGWFETSYTVAPVVRFYPNTGYAFHSRLYYPNGSTVLKDASIGYPISHGCVRMLTPDVTYIYNWIPNGTTVVIY